RLEKRELEHPTIHCQNRNSGSGLQATRPFSGPGGRPVTEVSIFSDLHQSVRIQLLIFLKLSFD
ncbi:MAG TPA: hypothetical protein PLW54_07450, partial [Bacteroidia bacterium]|nr:hypothetical protein [Bacteroidia bacterium]